MSNYLAHLPAFFQDDQGDFVGKLLLAFERILTGFPDDDLANFPRVPRGLEQILDTIHTCFDPSRTPDDFLPWLAGWVATSLREDWDTTTRRAFVAQIVPLYRQRGTAAALKTLLEIYLTPTGGSRVDVLEAPRASDPIFPDRYPPRYFQIRFTVFERDPKIIARRAAIATEIIDREKPAHTYYGLRIGSPSLEIASEPIYDGTYPTTGVFVGTNTLLGTNPFRRPDNEALHGNRQV